MNVRKMFVAVILIAMSVLKYFYITYTYFNYYGGGM